MASEKPIEDWSPSEVGNWLQLKTGLTLADEGKLLEEAGVSGVALKLIDRDCLKDIGIRAVGKQLEVLSAIKQLLGTQKPSPTSEDPQGDKPKIKKEDKAKMTPEQLRLYNNKVKVIRDACRKQWPGNAKVYFKDQNALILSEMVGSLEPLATIKEIGFGRAAISAHIKQWAFEKNRRISDGYDFEKISPPAKRARKREQVPAGSSENDVSTDAEAPCDEDAGSGLSDYSAQLIVAVGLGKVAFRAINYKKLCHVGKQLAIKTRGIGKYNVAMNVAKALIEQNYIQLEEGTRMNCVKRSNITVLKDIIKELEEEKSHAATSSTMSCNDSSPSPSGSESGTDDTEILSNDDDDPDDG